MFKLGILGYSAQAFNEEEATKILQKAILDAWIKHGEIEIVSGMTYVGIPKIAYCLAEYYGFSTTGIVSKKAQNSKYNLFPCDTQIFTGKDWKDASPFFVDYCDEFIRVGGGNISMNEVQMIKADGKPIIEYDL